MASALIGGAVIPPDSGEWLPHMRERLDEDELADWRAVAESCHQRQCRERHAQIRRE